MRSTRIRTLDRTLVTIPNGDFAAQQIENFTRRDKFRFLHTLTLRYETTPDQIRHILIALQSLLNKHSRVLPEPARARLLGLGSDALNIEVFAYIKATDFDGFLEVQEDLILRIMDIVAESGAGFAFPSQTLYFAQDATPDAEKARASEANVARLREAGELPLPRQAPDRAAADRDTLDYPDRGSVLAHAAAQSEQGADEPGAGKSRARWWGQR